MSDSNLKRISYSFILLMLCFLLLITYVKFNQKEVLQGRIAYLSESIIKAPFDGYLNKKLGSIHAPIKANDPVVLISANSSLNRDTKGNSHSDAVITSINQQLVEIEDKYNIRKKTISNAISTIKSNIDNEKRNKRNLELILADQREIFKVRQERIKKDKLLTSKGIMSKKEYEERFSDFLAARRGTIETEISISNSDNNLMGLNNNLTERTQELEEHEVSYITSKTNLNEKLIAANNNKESIIGAPQDGILLYSKFDKNNQFRQGDILARIVSEKMVAKLDLQNSSKARIKVGDIISIAVDALPYDTYGFLDGRIETIRDVNSDSNQNTYEIVISLQTTKKITEEMFMNGMSIKGFVDAEQTSILRLLLLPIINAVDNNFEVML